MGGLTISHALRKGGVGKTTTGEALAVEAAWDGKKKEWPNYKKYLVKGLSLAEAKQHVESLQAKRSQKLVGKDDVSQEQQDEEPEKVLVIDLDPQMNLTQACGIQVTEEQPSVYEVLLNAQYGVDYVVRQASSGIYVLPSSKRMDGIENDLVNAIARESRLREALSEAEGYEGYPITVQAVERYSKIRLIDCPPNLGVLTMNALAASDYVVVPVQTQYFAYEAMQALEQLIHLMKKVNKRVQLGGIICTMYDARTALSERIKAQLITKYGSLVFETVIPDNTSLAEAPAFGLSIQEYDHTCPGAVAYAKLYQEVKARFTL